MRCPALLPTGNLWWCRPGQARGTETGSRKKCLHAIYTLNIGYWGIGMH